MATYLGIGLMSGTSMDGLDIACCQFTESTNQYEFELIASEQVDFPEIWVSRLQNLPTQSAEIFAKTHVYFGHWLGETVQAFIKQHKLKPDFVAAHGQTIFHQPHKNFTTQIGDGETLVSYLNCPLVCNFRNKDVALGGQGAPLVPIGEKYLFPGFQLFLNLGGFSNLTYNARAFDVSACNIILNYLVGKIEHEPRLQYDPEGSIAASGSVHTQLLAALNALPYFHQPPPKSLGWEWVEAEVIPLLAQFDAPISDLLHTCCIHMAEQVGNAIVEIGATDQQMLITGGGRHNLFLMQEIEKRISSNGITINATADDSLTDYKEAIVFAFLGLRVLRGKPSTLHSVTGAAYDVLAGSIHLPPKSGISIL